MPATPMLRVRARAMRVATFVLALSSIGLAATSARAAEAASPFTCQPGFYQVLNGQLMLHNPSTGKYVNIGAARTDYNAIAFNDKDNFIYGLSNVVATRAHLLRVSSNGAAEDLGVPAGLPVQQYFTGDFDANGNLIVRSDDATSYYSINVAQKKATKLAVASGTPNGSDGAFVNGMLLSVHDKTLYRFDPVTRKVTTASISGLPAQTTTKQKTFGAAWSDKRDKFFVANNATGKIYEISGFTGANPTATEKSSGQALAAGGNDGASCRAAINPFAAPVANDDAYNLSKGDTVLLTGAQGVLENDIGVGLGSITITVKPQHGEIELGPDGSLTYVVNPGFSGVDTFKYTAKDAWGRVTNEATVTITVKPTVIVAGISEIRSQDTLADTGGRVETLSVIGALSILVGVAMIGLARRRTIA